MGQRAEHDRDAELEPASRRKADRRADPSEPVEEAAPRKGRRRPEPEEDSEPQRAAHGRAVRREVPEQESPRKARRQPDLDEDPEPERGRHGRDARLEATEGEEPRKGRRRLDPDEATEPERAHGRAVRHAEPDADADAELHRKGRRRAEPDDDAAHLDRGSPRGTGRWAEREDPPDEEPPVHRKAHRRAEREEAGEAARAIRRMAARDDPPSVAEMQARAPWRTKPLCCCVRIRIMRWAAGEQLRAWRYDAQPAQCPCRRWWRGWPRPASRWGSQTVPRWRSWCKAPPLRAARRCLAASRQARAFAQAGCIFRIAVHAEVCARCTVFLPYAFPIDILIVVTEAFNSLGWSLE